MNDLYKELEINPADTRAVIEKKLAYQQAKWELAATDHDENQRIIAKYKLNLVEEAKEKLLDTINKVEYDQQLDLVHKANQTKLKAKMKAATKTSEPDNEFIDKLMHTTLKIDDNSKQRAYRLQIQNHLDNDNYDVALNEAKKYVSDFSKSVDAWHQLAKVYASTQTYIAAENCYKHIIELESNNFEHYVNLGRIHLMQGQMDEALSLAEKAEELNFVHGIALKGDIYFIQKEYKKALKIYQHLAKFYEPSFFNIRIANCYMAYALSCFISQQSYFKAKSKTALKTAQYYINQARQVLGNTPNKLLEQLEQLVQYELTHVINKKRWKIPAGVSTFVFTLLLVEGISSFKRILFFTLLWGALALPSLRQKRINIKNRNFEEALYLPIDKYQFITLS